MNKNKRKIKLSILIFLLVFFSLFAAFKGIKRYISYAIMTILILHGANAIFDFFFGLPMQVGYSRVVQPSKDNETARIIGLLLASGMVTFALWWIISKLI